MWCSPSAFFARIRQGCTVKCPGPSTRKFLFGSQKRKQNWKKWTTKQKELLANAWNMTGSERKAIQSPALQSKRWRRNLVEDGDIEPNPGPCCCRFWNINTRGRDGAYKVLDLLRETKPHIVALQETNFDEVESEQFTRTASGCGYIGRGTALVRTFGRTWKTTAERWSVFVGSNRCASSASPSCF